jgi:hypothetical protein
VGKVKKNWLNALFRNALEKILNMEGLEKKEPDIKHIRFRIIVL